MKKVFTLLFITAIACSSINAQNLLDSAIVGYENANTNYKKAFVDEIWYGAFADSAFYRTDEQAYAGDASLAFNANSFESLTADKKLYFSSFPSASGTALPSGSYIVSYKLFLDASSSLNEIQTKTEIPAVTSKWDVTSTPKGEWVTMRKLVKYDSDISGKYYLQIPYAFANTGVTGAQKFYIDDHCYEAYEMDTIEGNYLDHYYYGFEAGSDDVDGLYIPSASDAVVTFETEMNSNPESNFYAVKFDVPPSSSIVKNNYTIQLGSKLTLGEPGNAVVPAGDYIMSVNVFMDERNINAFTTPFNANDATTQDEWLNITWDIPEDVALGEWVTLKQMITLSIDYDTKITIKADQSNLVDSTQNAVIYVDDLAFVDYVPSTQEEIYSFDGGINGDGDGVWFTTPAGDYFSVSDDKSFTGNNGLKYSCADSSLLPITKIQMGIGNAETANSFVNLDAGTYEISYKLWIEPGCDVLGINMNIKTPWTATGYDFDGLTRGEWLTMSSGTITLAEAAVNSNFQIILNEAKYGEGTFYIDDITITPTTPTGIDKVEKVQSSLYPNPATSTVNIVAQEGSRINIYTLSGATVRSINNANALTTLSVSEMKTGMYLVSIRNSNGTVVEKLQVK